MILRNPKKSESNRAFFNYPLRESCLSVPVVPLSTFVSLRIRSTNHGVVSASVKLNVSHIPLEASTQTLICICETLIGNAVSRPYSQIVSITIFANVT